MAIVDRITHSDVWENLTRRYGPGDGVNVGRTERMLSAAAGIVLGAFAMRRRRLRGVLLPVAGSLIARGVTGRCAINRALGRNTAHEMNASPVASIDRGAGLRIQKSIVIGRPPDELYRFWRDFENLPRFMDHLESVTAIDSLRSHWVAKAPAGTRVEWDAEIHNDIQNELIAWRSLPGADVPNAGSVHFRPTDDGLSTEVEVILRYEPPAGRLGAAVAKLFGEEPGQQVEDDLRRLKQVVEATEVSATLGQPGGTY